MSFVMDQFCLSQDGLSVSWIFVASVFALLWFKVLILKGFRK
jgi:hypothetical protein